MKSLIIGTILAIALLCLGASLGILTTAPTLNPIDDTQRIQRLGDMSGTDPEVFNESQKVRGRERRTL
jgi:hypothetical protein